jgi:hypothetical protein
MIAADQENAPILRPKIPPMLLELEELKCYNYDHC